MSGPECSICFSTRNKAESLGYTLASIYTQKPSFPFEVIVVDDGSADGTSRVCNDYPVRYIHLDNPQYRNPSVARNRAFRAAEGRVILAQSDDIIHVMPNTIEHLVSELPPQSVLLGRTHDYVYSEGHPHKFMMEYCGPKHQKPYFFLGAISREHLYAVGGYDEDFVDPCFDDNWLADCLTKGLGLTVHYTADILGHHQHHEYEEGSHDNEDVSRQLYKRKVARAERTGVWANSRGSWELPAARPPATAREPARARPPAREGVSGKIPRCMNFFWAGDRMSWMRYMTLRSFRRHHPDWQIVLHRMPMYLAGGKGWSSSETQDSEVYGGRDYLPDITEFDIEVRPWSPPDNLPRGLAPAHACDFCQWQLLSTTGGFYSDIDILYLAELPYGETKDADAVFCLTDNWMAIGLFASSPGNTLFRDIYDSALANYSPKAYQSTGAEAIYRLAGTWPRWGSIPKVGTQALQILRQGYPESTILDVPQVTVYPWNYRHLDEIFEKVNPVPAGCCGIHWFGGSTLGQKWNNILTHENWAAHGNTFTRCVTEIMR